MLRSIIKSFFAYVYFRNRFMLKYDCPKWYSFSNQPLNRRSIPCCFLAYKLYTWEADGECQLGTTPPSVLCISSQVQNVTLWLRKDKSQWYCGSLDKPSTWAPATFAAYIQSTFKGYNLSMIHKICFNLMLLNKT